MQDLQRSFHYKVCSVLSTMSIGEQVINNLTILEDIR